MATQTSLIQLILNLLNNPHDLAAFQEDPSGWLASCGAGDVSADDIHDALVLANDDDDKGHHHVPPPPHPHPGETDHQAAVRYLNTYVTNTYVDSRETNIDNSFHQKVDTGGGDFDQDLDYRPVSATGDGAVAAGGDIRDSTVTTGDDNQVGDGNVKGDGNVVGDGNSAVTGDGNTTGFGTGSVTSTSVGDDLTLGDGSAFATGGPATVNTTDNSVNDSGNVDLDARTTDSFNDLSDNHLDNVGNTEDDHSANDSGNQSTSATLNDVGNTDNHVDISGTV